MFKNVRWLLLLAVAIWVILVVAYLEITQSEPTYKGFINMDSLKYNYERSMPQGPAKGNSGVSFVHERAV